MIITSSPELGNPQIFTTKTKWASHTSSSSSSSHSSSPNTSSTDTKKLPPSPSPALPILGHLHLLKKPLPQTLSALSKAHGPILSLRFGSRPVLLVSSPSAAEECLTRNDVVFANRPKLLAGKHLGHNYTTLVWASYGQHWRNLRRLVSTQIL
ncbi:hypothetical protein RHGRI_021773 [Rhododendron griersonianum]|uniref:Cytochrome P450 n=1 Tax=Rhododendron griersonianum TaxID=479676 RepID=A0AAV6JRG7_9ERIC|nr:hypothetical protein RHGRI_021773 [Rhododendron griersonianum]